MRFLFSFLFLILFIFQSLQASTIRCSNAEYAGKELQFYKLNGPITGEKELLFTLQFDQQGNCLAKPQVANTTFVFSEFGVYKGLLLLEPNVTIELKLPPFREKSFSDTKNPYFSPVSFWFISEQKNTLNDKISNYEQELNKHLDKNFNRLYMQQSDSIFQTVIDQLDKDFPETKPKSFLHHKNLKLELVRSEIFRLRPESYSKVFNTISSKYWTHPAFTELFDKTFHQQLSFSAKAIGGKELVLLVQKKDSKGLIDYTRKKYHLSTHVADLAVLKMLHDAYYSKDFSKANIKAMITNPVFEKHPEPLVRASAKNIAQKVSFMEVKSSATEICLKNLEGKSVCTKEDDLKFKYILFADVETRVCQEHLKYLSRVNELFQKHLDIYVVLRPTDQKGIDAFYAKNKVPGNQMIDINNHYAGLYKIRSYPQCFLLDEKHRVVFNNTKAPLDGFEQQFGPWLQNELFMRQRNQAR